MCGHLGANWPFAAGGGSDGGVSLARRLARTGSATASTGAGSLRAGSLRRSTSTSGIGVSMRGGAGSPARSSARCSSGGVDPADAHRRPPAAPSCVERTARQREHLVAVHRPAPFHPHEDRPPGLEQGHFDIARQRQRMVRGGNAGAGRGIGCEIADTVVVEHVLGRVVDPGDGLGGAERDRIVRLRAVGGSAEASERVPAAAGAQRRAPSSSVSAAGNRATAAVSGQSHLQAAPHSSRSSSNSCIRG